MRLNLSSSFLRTLCVLLFFSMTGLKSLCQQPKPEAIWLLYDTTSVSLNFSGDSIFIPGRNWAKRHVFTEKCTFESSCFADTVIMPGSDFIKSFFLENTTCNKPVFFVNARANDIFVFQQAICLDDVSFAGSKFNKDADFSETKFLGEADFRYATFSNFVNFAYTKFRHAVDLSLLSFADTTTINFSETHFPDTINFSGNSHIPRDVDFTVANFNDSERYDKQNDVYFKKHHIYLYGTDISKIHIDYIHFRLITDSSLNSGEKIPNDETETMYDALLNNFKIRGQNESYRLLDIEYQKFKAYRHWWSIPSYWVNYAWWNCGYTKERVFLWTFCLLIAFSILNYFFLDYLNKNIYELEKFPVTADIKNPLIRLWLSLFYTSSIFFRLTLKIEKINYRKVGGTIYLLVIYTTGVICLAYMANFVLQR